jgi:hypothetical protein
MTSRSQKVKRIAIQCTSARTDFVTPEKSSIKAKHRFPASAIPIASHGRRSSLKTETRPPLTFSSQMNNPDTPSPRNEDAARVCHRWFVFKKTQNFFPQKTNTKSRFIPYSPGHFPRCVMLWLLAPDAGLSVAESVLAPNTRVVAPVARNRCGRGRALVLHLLV